MTDIDWSWLYGASQGQECPHCGDLIYPGPTPLLSHTFWCEKRPGRVWASQVTVQPDMSQVRAQIQQAAIENSAALDRLAR
jgi:hypothetical protein